MTELSFYEFFLLEAEEYPDWTFGVEVEVPMYTVQGGGVDRDAIVNQVIPKMQLGWDAKVDQTCMPGFEIVCKPHPITSAALGALENDLKLFKTTCEEGGIKFFERPGRCATHIHIGGLNMDTKIKIAELWTKGGLQDMQKPFTAKARQDLMANQGSYTRRVDSIGQYQTLPHTIRKSSFGKLLQKWGNWLFNTIGMDKYVGHDKSYSMSPRGGLGTLEFRTKESTLDGHEIGTIIRMIAALAAEADKLYGQMQSEPLQGSQVRKSMYNQGVTPKDMAGVMRNARGRTDTNIPGLTSPWWQNTENPT